MKLANLTAILFEIFKLDFESLVKKYFSTSFATSFTYQMFIVLMNKILVINRSTTKQN